MKHILFLLRELFFPAGCTLCGRLLLGAGETWYGLCTECRLSLRREEGDCCVHCGRPLVSEKGSCLPCRTRYEGGETPVLDGVIALFPYSGKYRRLLAAYKFGKNLALGHFLAEKLPEALPEEWGRHLVPVPPRPGKIRQSGWDQIENLARLLEKDCRIVRCLKRLPSESQKKLNREKRRQNLLGKIVAVQPPPETAVLFDDVITTGSTLEACAAALKSAGSKKVYGICFFYD